MEFVLGSSSGAAKKTGAAPSDGKAPVAPSSTPEMGAPATRSVPLSSRIGSLMAASIQHGWFAGMKGQTIPASLNAGAAASSGGKEPLLDPIVNTSGYVCKDEKDALDSMVSHLLKPGGLVDSMLKSNPSITPAGAAYMEQLLAKILHGSSVANIQGAIQGLLANGRSVVIIFDGLFTHTTVLPSHFAGPNLAEISPLVNITGGNGVSYEIKVQVKGDAVEFAEGWSEFVAAEKIVMGDMGLFIITGDKSMSMCLYDSNGAEKPMAMRPEAWNLFVAYHDEVAQAPAAPVQPEPAVPPANNFIVPDHVRGMRYKLGPRLFMNEPIVERLAHVWVNFRTDYPLYAVSMTKTHLKTGIFYFCTPYSELLPYMPKDCNLYYSTAAEGVKGKLKKRYGDGLARITKGWRTFVRLHGIQLDDVFVFSIQDTRAGLNIRAFPVAMA